MISQDKKIAGILFAGSDGAGGNTLAKQLQLSEIDIDIYCNNKNHYGSAANKKAERRYRSFTFFSNLEELFDLVKDYDVILVITPPFEKVIDLNEYYDFLRKLSCKKILLNVDRSKKTAKKVLISKDHISLFDKVLVISNNVKDYVNELIDIDCQLVDVNVYSFHKEFAPIKLRGRKKEIAYIGRFANFKGYHHFFNWILDNKDKLPEYTISFEGGLFKYNKHLNKKISSTIGICIIICKDLISKELRGEAEGKVIYHNDYDLYDEDMKMNCIHMYPSYKLKDMLKRMKNKMFVIFPTGYDKKVESVKKSFSVGLEYTWLEMIDLGVPIICSSTYGKVYKINGKPIIDQDCGLIFFDDFNDVPDLIKQYIENYDKNVLKMKRFFIKNYNTNIINDLKEAILC